MEPSEAGVERSGTVVETPGFTLIEEDDVAFTLQLCREVHRLYGDYQVGSLPSDDYVLAGLAVSMEMLAVLSRQVTDGMPAMRITVAAAQTREMLAVMFGRDPLEGPLDGRFRAHYRAIVDESARALASHPAPLPPRWAEAALGRSQTGAAPLGPSAPDVTGNPSDPGTVLAPVPEVIGPPTSAEGAPAGRAEVRRSRLRRLFGRRSG